MANRKLIVEIIGDSRSLERSLSKSQQATRRFNVGLGTIVKGAVGFLAVQKAADLAGDAIRAGIGEFSEAAKVQAQTNAVLKSTAGAANVSAKQVERLADSISRLSGIDDEAIQSGENLLLTFKNVRNEVGKGNAIFDRAARAAVNLSVAGFGSIDTTAKQLGKALNDPVKGMTALSRAGVTFTAAQKNTIKALVATGRTLDAQKLILREVESQVGGSAKALGQTLPGQLNKLRETVKNTLGDLAGVAAGPLQRALEGVNEFTAKLGEQRTVRAKLAFIVEGGRDLAAKLLAQFGAQIDRIDWGQVGRAVSDGIKTGIDAAARFLTTVDWGKVGQKIVRGLADFLLHVDWKGLFVNVYKLMFAAMRAVVTLQIGIIRGIGTLIVRGIAEGFDRAKDFVIRKVLEFVNRIVSITSFLGRFDPFKGVRSKIKASLDGMAADAQRATGKVQASIDGIHGKTVEIVVQATSRIGGEGPGRGETVETNRTARAWKSAMDAANKIVSDAIAAATRKAKAQPAALKPAVDAAKARTKTAKELVRASNDAADAATEAAAAAKREAAALLQARQFRALGLAPTGEERTPTIANLRKQLKSLTERLAASGTTVSSKLRGQLAGIRKVLSGEFGKATEETRAKIKELFDAIRGEFDTQSRTGPLTKTSALNASKIVEGLGLGRDLEKELRARLSRFNSAGLATGARAGQTAFAGTVGQPIVINTTVELDRQAVGQSTKRFLLNDRRHNPPQKRGPNAG